MVLFNILTVKPSWTNQNLLVQSLKNQVSSKVDAKKAVEAFVDTVSNELKEGGKVALLGFGSFSVSEKAARKGVNPKTKETIEIAARKAVKFKAGAELNELIK